MEVVTSNPFNSGLPGSGTPRWNRKQPGEVVRTIEILETENGYIKG
jgi:hypothetical protein